ncbi:hypothetical protein SEVIR_9G305101v4 [Setaria viridis]
MYHVHESIALLDKIRCFTLKLLFHNPI